MEVLAGKEIVLRDRKIVTALFFLICIAFAVALWMYGRVLDGTARNAPRREPGPGASA
jgi:hypothetical protein